MAPQRAQPRTEDLARFRTEAVALTGHSRCIADRFGTRPRKSM
jgi:hypothetical protein